MSQESVTLEENLRQVLETPGIWYYSERWWAKRQKALEEAGYMLRPRFHLDWVPPWEGTNKYFRDFEEGQPSLVSLIPLHQRGRLTSLSAGRIHTSWMLPASQTGHMSC